MKLCAELGATEFKEKNHKSVNFCSILEKVVLMCIKKNNKISYIGQFLFNFGKNGNDVFRKGIGLHICTPNIHSSPTQGGGSLSLMFH